MQNETKTFPLRVLLTVTTGRLLTQPTTDGGNGIGDLYAILGWMTNDSPFTHQLPAFARECEPELLRLFPELKPPQSRMDELDKKIKTMGGKLGIERWLESLTDLKSSYEVPRLPDGVHAPSDPITSLIDMMARKQ